MNSLSEFIDALGATSVWTYVALFLAASVLMIWRLDALLKQGLDGTALGTLVMPYCSGLGNLLFVAIIAGKGGPAQEVLTNCIVNNVTNLTVVLGLPAILWGLRVQGQTSRKKRTGRAAGKADVSGQLDRLALLLSLAAVLFFGGVTWALASDGVLDRRDGTVLIALFLFWQCFQVFDVLKHNVRERRSFRARFYLDLLVVALGAYALYVSIDWLVTWVSAQRAGFVSAANMGWLSGWLMVLPNALLACYYAARQRGDVVYASQIGDGHICIPLCLGLIALVQPVSIPAFFQTGLLIFTGAALVHVLAIMLASGLPRLMGWPLLFAYGWFVAAGFSNF
ncbi:MAG: sodium:calcium symporter [Opitutus sp.]